MSTDTVRGVCKSVSVCVCECEREVLPCVFLCLSTLFSLSLSQLTSKHNTLALYTNVFITIQYHGFIANRNNMACREPAVGPVMLHVRV